MIPHLTILLQIGNGGSPTLLNALLALELNDAAAMCRVQRT